MKRWCICILAAAVTAGLFSSCSFSSFTDEEIRTAAAELIEASVAINEIYFGEGLPSVEEDSDAADAFSSEIQTDTTLLSYLPVSEDAGYTSIDGIKEATEKVYSQSYCEYLFEMAFSGISTDNAEATYARYLETDSGTLAVHKELSVMDARTYDTKVDNIEVQRKSGNTAIVEAQSYVNGEEDVTVEVQMIYEDGAWRLDSPTY